MDLYGILKVSPQSSQAEIKQAYYEMAKLYHPDSNQNHADTSSSDGNSTTHENVLKEKFQQVQMAYEILSNQDKRQEYDGYRGRSYYENQYQEANQSQQGTNNEGEWESDKEKYKATFSGYEWYLLTPSQLMFWGFVSVLSENFYEQWHLN